jgi:hypothetical protein
MAVATGSVLALVALVGCGAEATHTATDLPATSGVTTPGPAATIGSPAATIGVLPPAAPVATLPTATTPATAASIPTTTAPCPLSATPGTANTVPIGETCSAVGAPHFATPQQAMTYLAAAWNTDDVQEIDYVTDPEGRAQLDSMASLMVDLRFTSCSENPTGDYTCYFSHRITPSTSPTTYPNPMGYPPGEAVFTVAPATGPGWYLTLVIHCG